MSCAATTWPMSCARSAPMRCIQDGTDLPERAREASGGAPIRLGIDAISGEATRRIADSVSDGAVVVNYGSLSGEDPVVSRAALTLRGVMLTGFILGRGLAKRSPEQVRALYAELGTRLRDGVLQAPVDSTYPIEQIREALIHAQRAGRHGKILVLPNGPLGNAVRKQRARGSSPQSCVLSLPAA